MSARIPYRVKMVPRDDCKFVTVSAVTSQEAMDEANEGHPGWVAVSAVDADAS